MADQAIKNLPTLRQLLARVHLRLILFAVALAAISLMVSGIMVIRGYAQRNLELIAHTVSYTVEPAVLFGDPQSIREGLVSVAGIDGVDRAEVHDPAGHVLAQWSHIRSGGLRNWVERSASALLWPSPSIVTVRRGPTPIAVVRIYGNSEGILGYALSGSLIALSCLGLTVIATRILARRLEQDVIAPLDYVATVAHAVRRDRAFEKRVPSSGIAEIDRFSHDFNALLAELQGWHAGLTSENAELARRATHDPLTGLGNRVLFAQMLGDAIAGSLRSSKSLAVIYLDVDDFKQINDSHGHGAGDATLIAVAERLRASIRQVDQAFRLGGDEFAVVLAPFIEQRHLQSVLARIEASMEHEFALPGGQLVSVTMSMGVAVYPDDGISPQDLLRRADAEMYLQKNRRRENGKEGLSYA